MARRAAAGIVGAAALLGAAVITLNPIQGCAVHDAPYAEFSCAPGADRTPAVLLERLRRNPADIDALKLYAMNAGEAGEGRAISLLAHLWPHDPEVLGLRAAAALRLGQWTPAADALVQLVAVHDSDPAAAALARLAGAGNRAALSAHLPSARAWLPRVIASGRAAGVPASALAPLVAEALRLKALDRAVAARFVEQLQASGDWVDAHALWGALHGQAVPVLYNAGFDRPFVGGGFDWQIAPQPQGARAGAVIERTAADKRGFILVVRLNGKRFHTPLVRQHLLVAGARFTLRGEYLASQLRMEKGLAWVARCTRSAALAGRSAPLLDTAREWRRFEMLVQPPEGCGPVVTLQLEAADPVEAEIGAVGQIQFDALVLEGAGLHSPEAKGLR